MYLILEHTSLAQYGMSHLAKGMIVPVIGSLVVAFSLLCMAKEFTSLLAFQCGDCFYCCCHSYIIFRNQMFIITLLVNDLYSASISAHRSLLSGCTLLIASSKRRASLPLSTGVSAISLAIIMRIKMNIRCKDTKNIVIILRFGRNSSLNARKSA